MGTRTTMWFGDLARMAPLGNVDLWGRFSLHRADSLEIERLYAVLDGLPWGSFVVTLDQRILYWSQRARALLGYDPGAMVGRRCWEVPNGLDRFGLTADCDGGCSCLRYARAGLVPAATTLEMRSASGEVHLVDVMPLALAPVGSLDRLLVYLMDVREAPAAALAPGWILGADAGAVGDDESALTAWEMDVLRLVALGWSNERIGDELGVTLNTVRTHLANLRAKLDAETRLEAVMAGLRLGLLELR